MILQGGESAASIIAGFARHRTLSYVEMRSYTTGIPTSMELDRVQFARRKRYCYATTRQAEEFEIARRIPDRDTLIRLIVDGPDRFDVAFADPWHTVEDTCAMLSCAIRVVAIGGLVMLHDCRPRDDCDFVDEPGTLESPWSGRTWFAWWLFLEGMDRTEDVCTLDIDEGVGVVNIGSEESRARLLHVLDEVHDATERLGRFEQLGKPSDCAADRMRLIRVGDTVPDWLAMHMSGTA